MMISECKLLKGSHIDIGICKVYPLTLDEIVDEIGEIQYNQLLSVLMLDKSTLNPKVAITPQEKEDFKKLTSYNVLAIHSYHDDTMREMITSAFSIFLKENVSYHKDGYFYIGDKINSRKISSEGFELIKKILIKQNYLENSQKDTSYKPANDRAKQLLEKIKAAKEKLQKQNKEEGLHLSDVISIVSTYSNDINILSVWNLTIYQLYESYLRIIMWDEYHNNLLLLPHVSDNNSVNMKHWASKLNK
jgi:uncharacterized protein (UPF0147 family)